MSQPIRNLLVVSFIIVLSSCSSTPETMPSSKLAGTDVAPTNAEMSEQGTMICTYEKVPGKLIKEKTCYTKEQRERIRESSQELARDIKRSRAAQDSVL